MFIFVKTVYCLSCNTLYFETRDLIKIFSNRRLIRDETSNFNTNVLRL